MNVKQKVAELNLPKGSYIVAGSGILGALGIRESNDIDLVVSEDIYQGIAQLGWEQGLWGEGLVFKKDVFDIGNDWYGKTAAQLLDRAQVVDDIPH